MNADRLAGRITYLERVTAMSRPSYVNADWFARCRAIDTAELARLRRQLNPPAPTAAELAQIDADERWLRARIADARRAGVTDISL